MRINNYRIASKRWKSQTNSSFAVLLFAVYLLQLSNFYIYNVKPLNLIYNKKPVRCIT